MKVYLKSSQRESRLCSTSDCHSTEVVETIHLTADPFSGSWPTLYFIKLKFRMVNDFISKTKKVTLQYTRIHELGLVENNVQHKTKN